jgi:hypothetical protein
VFDRACTALQVVDSTPLLAPSLATELAAWLERYGEGLI